MLCWVLVRNSNGSLWSLKLNRERLLIRLVVFCEDYPIKPTKLFAGDLDEFVEHLKERFSLSKVRLLECDISKMRDAYKDYLKKRMSYKEYSDESKRFERKVMEIGPQEACVIRRGLDVDVNLPVPGDAKAIVRIVDGEVEAHLIALRCSEPPEGRNQWNLRLLADQLVELEIVTDISHETVRQALKKTS